MNYTFSNRISELKPSAIREILKVTQDPNVIPFAAGNPAPEAFPVKEMSEISERIFREMPASALQYGVSEGYMPLRQAVRERMQKKYATGTEEDDVIIVTGAQQGMELTTKCFINEGDGIICESPSFIGSLNCFRSYRANLIGVPMEQDGMDLEKLENALRENDNVKFIYVIPTFQNPTGRVMSLAKREKILELARQYDVMILEDNPYFELRYSGENLPTIKSMDTEGRVIYVGSFSKILSPGIRVGFVLANSAVISKLTVAKQVSDVHTNLMYQMIAHEMLTKYDIDAHIAKVCDMYREKRDAMCDAIEKYFPKECTYERPDGGLFLWCRLPDGYDGVAFCKLCGTRGVMGVPGSSFAIDENEISPYIRLNFSLPSFEQIERGVKIMGDTMREFIG
ncbi:MAG: PLP-dependent aminotransferase family protein [Ruminococcaceae bacterium]|nr:PLP-dependent aminotransferase family protein [Oscillospiraceae bacterium]